MQTFPRNSHGAHEILFPAAPTSIANSQALAVQHLKSEGIIATPAHPLGRRADPSDLSDLARDHVMPHNLPGGSCPRRAEVFFIATTSMETGKVYTAPGMLLATSVGKVT